MENTDHVDALKQELESFSRRIYKIKAQLQTDLDSLLRRQRLKEM